MIYGLSCITLAQGQDEQLTISDTLKHHRSAVLPTSLQGAQSDVNKYDRKVYMLCYDLSGLVNTQ